MKKLIPLLSRQSRKLSATRRVVLLMFTTAILFVVGAPNIIHSAASPKSESSSVTPFTGPLTLVVNTLGDAADTNVGDGLCDTDSGTAGEQCTLRAALQETNAVSSTDTINFSLPPNSTITLITALPDIAGNLTIGGPGASLLTIQRSSAGGTASFRVFTIDAGTTVTISGVTISNGDAIGGIFPENGGGGILNDQGTVTINDSIVRSNHSGLHGGGISNYGGAVTINRSTITGNTAAGSGGGVFNVHAYSISLPTLTIDRSTISNNTAGDEGGGIFNGTTITNTTISSNNARVGGGVENEDTMTLSNVTIAGNNATTAGGGIENFSGTLTFSNTIIAANTSPSGPDCYGTDFSSNDYNLIGNTTGGTITGTTTHNITGVDPVLGPLQDNGGSTMTRALLPGSPAIDAGNSSQTTDQRGQPRPIDDPNVTNAAGGSGSDIGAYEANIFQVNTTVDDDDGACTALGTGNGCTLREAINAANANFGEVAFAPALTSGGPATITFPIALPDITSSIVIQGPGANLLTVKRSTVGGTPDFRIFTIHAGTSVNISGMTISNGKLTAPLINGGGVLNSGTLTLNDCKFYGNSTANLGGGVFNGGPSLTIINCNFGGTSAGQANSATPGGGGIFSSGGTLLMTGGSIAGNSRNGITIIGGTATLNGVAITNNAQTNGAGGGIAVNPGTMNIINCLIAGNTATAFGGGIWNGGGTVKVINTTISANFAGESGGGVINQVGSMTLTNVTITNNRSDSDNSGGERGGGIARNGSSIVLKNTIVAGNFRGASPSTTADDDFNVFSTVDSSSSFNLIGTCTSCGLTNGTNNNQVGVVNPGLGALSSNGGPTQTHALLPSSPAIDAGDNCVLDNSCSPALASTITTDQRGAGFSRSADGNGAGVATVDIGAYEVQSILVTNTNDGGAGSLRQAITDANASPGTKAINLQAGLTGTITLLSALPDLSTSMSINGPGANLVTVQRSTASGTPSFRIFTIQSVSVNISGLTISGGNFGGGGAGILSSFGSTVNIASCVVSGNTDNGFQGGGISSSGTLSLANSTVSGNTGNGIFTNGGIIAIRDSTISNNVGSGISHSSPFAFSITNSTISGNNAGLGGGIFMSGGFLTMTNSTVSGNTANEGGGIFTSGGTTGDTLILTNCTIAGNIGRDGGILVGAGIHTAGTLTLRNSIVAGNLKGGGTGPDDIAIIGSVNSASYNLIGDAGSSGGITNGTNNNQVGVANPLIGALANNGGPTQTRALLPGSPAINAGDNCVVLASGSGGCLAAPLTTDQRGSGFARQVNGTVDIGAFESRGFTIAATGGTPQSATITAAFASPLIATVSSAFGEPVAGGVVAFTAPASGASGTFAGGGTSMTVTANSSGVATSPTFTANGTVASYVVTANANGISSAATFGLTNTKGVTTTSVGSSVNPSGVGQNITFTATVFASAPSPTGTVQFVDNGTNLGAPVNCGPGPITICIAQLSTSSLSLGTHTITADYSGDANFATSAGTLSGGQVVGSIIKFSSATYSVNESGGFIIIAVNRSGSTSGAVTVDYATDDTGAPTSCANTTSGLASSRCDYTTALGTLRFAATETQKIFVVLITQDSYTEGPEMFTVRLSNLTGAAVLATPSNATVTINDSASPTPNAIDDAAAFVRMHYHDFLNREPDAAGLNFWANQITSCGSDPQCIEIKRINVSAAFFLSIEFQETGYLVERLYKTAYGDADQISNFGGSHPFKAPIIRAGEFLPDTQEIALGVVVGQTGWETVLENNKRAFTAEFVQRDRFTAAFPPSMTPAQFVDTLNTNAGNPLSPTERNQLVADLTANTKTRADVLRAVAEDPDLVTAEFNRAFVLMQFFGYLRRNPNETPDFDYTGYDFWLTKLNQFNGNFVNADMVKAFITSSEYRQRFGP